MRFCADHSVHGGLVRALAAAGADVVAARAWGSKVTDAQVLALATEDDRILIAQDSDFGSLVFKDGLRATGVIFIRYEYGAEDQIAGDVARILALPRQGRGAFVTMDTDRVRIRPLPNQT